jgi:hypothetical protein
MRTKFGSMKNVFWTVLVRNVRLSAAVADLNAVMSAADVVGA